MQYRKCIALFAAALVGFGVATVDAVVTVSSVTITTPNSGITRGIDSSFVATAVVEDFSKDATDGVLFWLIVGNDSTVVGDSTTDNDDTAFGLGTLDALVKSATTTTVLKNSSGTTVVAGNFVAAAIGKNDTAAGAHKGDASSITVVSDATGNVLTYTWTGTVSSSSGTVQGIRVAAAGFDSTLGAVGSAVVSAAAVTFNIDGDRPTHSATMASDSSAIGTKVAPRAFGGVSVLGIGDSIAVNVKLGGQANEVLGTSSTLSVKAIAFGKTFDVPKIHGEDTLQFSHIITAGDYANYVGSTNANGRTDTIAVYIVDAAGNFSSAGDDAVAAGVTVPVNFFVDATAPVLDGLAAGDTILPVSTDTITDGTAGDANIAQY